jgi:hypothetical protein
MSEDAQSTALGFRVKSGWATAVLVAGSVPSPQVLDRRAIDLCDPAIPSSRQPYHAAMGKLQTDQDKIKHLREVVFQAARQSVTALFKDYRTAGHRVSAAGLVIGSETDPATITNPHMRAHGLEGQLFRSALEQALRSYCLPCLVITERKVYPRAAEAFGMTEEKLTRTLTQLGRSLGGPWRADEKTASLAAWLALAGS